MFFLSSFSALNEITQQPPTHSKHRNEKGRPEINMKNRNSEKKCFIYEISRTFRNLKQEAAGRKERNSLKGTKRFTEMEIHFSDKNKRRFLCRFNDDELYVFFLQQIYKF